MTDLYQSPTIFQGPHGKVKMENEARSIDFSYKGIHVRNIINNTRTGLGA